GYTVNVEAGTYNQNPTINKSLTVRGANAGVSGSGIRGSETNVVTNGNQNAVFIVSASNVTIDGFTLDGDDPLLDNGHALTSGDDANATYGVHPSGAFSNVAVQNDIIKHVQIGFRGDGAATGGLITRNWFDSVGVYDFGYAVTLRTNYYAD